MEKSKDRAFEDVQNMNKTARDESTAKTSGPKGWGLVIALGIATALTLLAGLVLVATSGHPERLFGVQAEMAVPTSKLAGAQESTDANGVVRGTTSSGVNYVVYGRNEIPHGAQGISFAALGDVMATDMNFSILDAYSGKEGDDIYSFEPYYKELAPALQPYDLRFVNQETAMAGNTGGFEYSGYPAFNTPASSVEAMAKAGFNIVNFNSNHTWDMGEQGITNSHEVFAAYPDMMLLGSYANQQDRDTVHMVQRGDMTVAFLSYTYGSNMYGDTPEIQPNNYYACVFDKGAMTVDVKRAQSVADAVVVYMHWGTEEMFDPDAVQLDYAQFLADLDVDLVIGSHAHLPQTTKYYTSASGKKVPVVFGLSDLISGWTITDTILSGMFTCDFVWKDGRVAVDNLAWHPLIEWSDGGDVYVRLLEHMTDEEIAANTRTEDVADDVAYMASLLDSLEMDCAVTWPRNITS